MDGMDFNFSTTLIGRGVGRRELRREGMRGWI